MRKRTTLLTTVTFVAALVFFAFIAGGSATIIEKRSRNAVRIALETAGHSWVQTQTDGLRVELLGTAVSEAERYRAVTLASTIVDSSRIIDNTDAETEKAIAPPDFSLEVLRNDDGISLIGLAPAKTDREALLKALAPLAGDGTVTDMLETADYPEPKGWREAYDFGIATLKTLPRAKISIDPGKVQVEAITDSTEEKGRVETSLARTKPEAVTLEANISAPRPVITPFTLRFVMDAQVARFDACSADNERARNRILAAAREAGAKGSLGCTIGMGTPSAQWSDAVVKSIAALRQMGAGTLSISDADIALVAADTVEQSVYDAAVGALESNLPEVFSLKAERAQKVEAKTGLPEFSALLRQAGQVELRGRVPSERDRDVLESFAKAQFGARAVIGTTRVDRDLPKGWAIRIMTALEALRVLAEGEVTVTPDQIRLSGLTGDAEASNKISRLIAARLSENARIDLAVTYEKRLDPTLNLPNGPECVTQLNALLSQSKITFGPSSAAIPPEGEAPLDALAQVMAQCQDFRMEVAGHTDSQGGEDGNQRLSQLRAEAILEALRSRKVLTGNLIAKGYGESRPIADNATEEGREANRRIEFVLLDAEPLEVPTPPQAVSAPPPEQADSPAPSTAAPAEDPPIQDEPAADALPMEPPPMEATPPATEQTQAEIPPPPLVTEAPVDAPVMVIPPPPLGPLAQTDPTPEIPVADAEQSPGRPQPRPEGLGTPAN